MSLLFTAHDMAHITDGHWVGDLLPVHAPTHLAINSTELGPSGCFIALKGEKRDGHDFVAGLDANSGQMALVSRQIEGATVPQLVVADVLHALHALARHSSEKTDAVKIAITGSAGKTGTKEIVAHGLSVFGKTYATKGNLNNHIGLPLTLANLPSDCAYCVAEMGMNHAGEIRALSNIFQPDIAIITTISAAHIGHFDGLSAIAKAKAEIFEGFTQNGLAILPRDNAYFDQLAGLARSQNTNKILSFGADTASDIQLISAKPDERGQLLTIKSGDMTLSGHLGMAARHWAVNSLAFIAICQHLGLNQEAGLSALSAMADLPGRGQHRLYQRGSHRCILIDDAYNANPDSMKAALAELSRYDAAEKGAILSDILELGRFAEDAHHGLKTDIEAAGITQLIAIGPFMTSLAGMLNNISVQAFDTWQEAHGAAHDMMNAADVILLKGSHGSGAHHIAADLMAAAQNTSLRQTSCSGGEPHVA